MRTLNLSSDGTKLQYKNNAFIGGDQFQIEKQKLKSVAGASWNPEFKTWDYPVRPDTVDELNRVFDGQIVIPKEVMFAIRKVAEQEEMIACMKQEGWERATPDAPMPIKVKPFNHQVLAFNIGIKLPRTAFLMEQGCGKSFVTVALTGYRYLLGQIKRVLIFAPASVVPVWPREFGDYADYDNRVFTLTGSVESRKNIVKNLSELYGDFSLMVLVTNYEASWRMQEELTNFKPDLVICDESQRIKGNTEQTKAVIKIAENAPYRMILTGTPLGNSPMDAFYQYKFLEPSIFGKSFTVHRSRYAIVDPVFKSKVISFINREKFNRKFHSIAFRCTKKECLDLPEEINQTLYCELEPKARKIYDQMRIEMVSELSNGEMIKAPQIITQMLRLSQMTGGWLVDRNQEICEQVSTAKIKLLKETLQDLLEAGKKVVIFTRFTPEIQKIGEMIDEELKVIYTKIDGSVPLSLRGDRVKEFQTVPEVRIFLANIQCAGLGITLTAADTAIFYSLDYSLMNYLQCRARIHRIGQRNNCTYIHLVAQKTIDEKIMKVLLNKQEMADSVVDRWREIMEVG